MRPLFAAGTSQLPLPPTSTTPAAATTSNVPMDDYTMWYLIAIGYLACVVISMVVFTVMTICHRRRRSSLNNSSASPEPQAYFMVVELTPLIPCKRGLKKSTLKALPKIRYEKAADLENQAECTICLTEFEEGKWIRKLPHCGHEFHVRCIDKWLRSQPSCPCCRTEVVMVPRPKTLDENDALIEE